MGQEKSKGTDKTTMNEDPTKIKLNVDWPQTNVKRDVDPMVQRFSGVAYHGDTPFDVPFISHIEGNLYQGGIDSSLKLKLPHFFKHVISVYPWESYVIEHNLRSHLSVMMYDSTEQDTGQVDAIADWVNACIADGPTLVHCQAGLNRSSLIVGRTLMFTGFTADEAIATIRNKRSSACLCNPAFEEYLRSLDA